MKRIRWTPALKIKAGLLTGSLLFYFFYPFEKRMLESKHLSSLPGNSNNPPASVEVYFDFLCPFCRKLLTELKLLQASMGERVQIKLKMFPLDNECNPLVDSLHSGSCKLALVALCGLDHGKSLPFLLSLKKYSNLSSFSFEELLKLSELKNGKDCLKKEKTYRDQVRRDVQEGSRLSVSKTPTIFINGQKYLGPHKANSLAVAIKAL